MAQERLTERKQLIPAEASENLVFYVVDKNDVSEHPEGSSFQVSREDLITILGVGSGGVDLSGYQTRAEKGAALGYASLDANKKVYAEQLPSYVDDIIDGYYTAPTFYSDVAETIPIVGETGKIYIDLKTNRSYRWSGSAYARVDDFDLTAALSNAPAKAVPVGADRIPLLDSVTGFLRNFTLTNLVTFLQVLFDIRYKLLYDRLIKDLAVTGTYTFNIGLGETWRINMTGNTVFSQSNIPPINSTKPITIHMTGNFAPTWPTGWNDNKTGTYDGAKFNTIVVEFIESGEIKVQITQEG